MSTFPSASYDEWKLRTPEEDAERIFGPHDEDDDEPPCDRCGGDGVVELIDEPDLWAEDCFVEENRLIPCPIAGPAT
jgi:hypothetical protein